MTSVGAVASFGLALSLAMGATFQSRQASPGSEDAAGPPTSVTGFAGVWDYNADESVNAATGRPEQDPRNPSARSASAGRQPAAGATATTRRPAGVGLGPGGAGGTRDPAGVGPGSGGGSAGGAVGPDDWGAFSRGWAAAWSRSAARDLLEVPEALTIDVTGEAVTFTDDLERARTYPTNGKKRKFQLGSAVFNAKTYWEGPRLKKEIDSVGGFRMTETYFLSEDGSRLFVVIRIGESAKSAAKNVPVMGVNRVYDRVR